MQIGFLGLGSMGAAMAAQLVDAGHTVSVWNRSPGAAHSLVERGARLAATAAEACSAPVVLSMLANDAAFEAAVLAEASLAAVRPGAVHVNHSTVSLELADRAEAAFTERGASYVAAPVFGRPLAAQQGQLAVIAAGPPEAVAAVAPAFDAVATRTWIVGERARQANAVKILGNFMIATTIESFGEAIGVGERLGVDAEMLVEILTGTLFGGAVHTGYGGRIARREYTPPGFTTALGLKDVRLALDAAAASGTDLPLAQVVRDAFEAAIADGDGNLDWAAVAERRRPH